MNYILATCIVISNIITSFAFVGIANRLSRSIERHNYYKPANNIQCNLHNNNANNANNANIDRRSVIKLIPIISIISLSEKSSATMESRPQSQQSPLQQRRPRSVVVFGASGYTGGDTIRALLEKNISVVAVTRRKVDIVDREHAKLNTLVIDDLDKFNKKRLLRMAEEVREGIDRNLNSSFSKEMNWK